MIKRPVVVKFGGELLDRAAHLSGVVTAVGRVARQLPLVVVHGGGKEIDTALRAAGIEKRQVDGLRVTDEATLDVVVGVLAGSVNTRFVAAAVGGRREGGWSDWSGCGLRSVRGGAAPSVG